MERHEQYDVYQSGHLLFSLPDRGETAPVSTLFLLQHPSPRDICLVGGTISGHLKDLIAFPGVRHVDAVEFDPRVPEIAGPFAGPEDQAALLDPRVTSHDGDGRQFLHREGALYDLIICLLPEPDTIQVNRFYTSEFFRAARARLNEGGVLAIGPLASSGAYVPEELLSRNAAVWRTLRGEFSEIAATPGPLLFLIACDTPGRITLSEDVLVERMQKAGGKLVDIFPYCEAFYVEKTNHELTGSPGTTTNTDDRPLGAYQSLRVWARTVGGGAEVLAWTESRATWWPVLPGLVVAGLLARAAWRSRRGGARTEGAAGALGFISGFAGMVLELAIFHRFQTAYGAVYGAIGALVALFLGGIALGGWLGGAMKGRRAGTCAPLLLGFLLAGWAWALPRVLGDPTSTLDEVSLLALFGGSMLLTGSLVGAIYPAALRLSPNGAGSLYALDLAGGALGAILGGTVLIPLIGVSALCTEVALLVAATSIGAGVAFGPGVGPDPRPSG